MSQNSYEYEVVLADTEESKQIHYQLRYQIYCLEKGFLKVENPEEEMEKDLYDDKSIHFLVKSGNRWIGTFRLVIDHLGGLPFYKVSVPDSPQFTEFNQPSPQGAGNMTRRDSKMLAVCFNWR